MGVVRKIENNKGFSIAELLVAILILSMVSAVVAGGIPVARDAYNKITVAANAQVLQSTAIYALRNELGTALEIYEKVSSNGEPIESSGKEIEYKSRKNGNRSKISMGDNGCIMLQEFLAGDKTEGNALPLAPGTDELYATYDTIVVPPIKEGDSITIKIINLTVRRGESPEPIVAPINLTIQTMGTLKNEKSV